MVDFDTWGAAVSQALGKDPTAFVQMRVQETAAQQCLDTRYRHVAEAVQQFMAGKQNWSGTSSDLFGELGVFKTDMNAVWPQSPVALGMIRNKLNALLEEPGIRITKPVKRGNQMILTVESFKPVQVHAEVKPTVMCKDCGYCKGNHAEDREVVCLETGKVITDAFKDIVCERFVDNSRWSRCGRLRNYCRKKRNRKRRRMKRRSTAGIRLCLETEIIMFEINQLSRHSLRSTWYGFGTASFLHISY